MEGLPSYLRRKPLQRRLWVLTTLAVTAAILLSNVAGYVALRATLYHASQSTTATIAKDLVGPASGSIRRDGRLDDLVRQAGGVIVEVVTAGGDVTRVQGEPQALVIEAQDLSSAAPGGALQHRVGVDTAGAAYMVVSVPLEDAGFALVVARPLSTIQGVLATERLIALGVSAASLLASVVLAGFVSRSALRPVRQLTMAVEHVTDTKDFQPIAVRYAGGDLAILARAFNGLLRSVARMRERQACLVA